MEQLTENDHGAFKVTTLSGTEHIWVVNEDYVTVERKPKEGRAFDWPMAAFRNGQPNVATSVERWPTVGQTFLYYMHGDVHWTRSSTVKSIERIS